MKKEGSIVALSIIIVLAIILVTREPSTTEVQQETKSFEIQIQHTRYVPLSVAVNQGDIVQLHLTTEPGTAAYSHGLTITEYGINQLVTTETTPTTITFVADKKGTFQGFCGTCSAGPFGTDAPDKRFTLIVN